MLRIRFDKERVVVTQTGPTEVVMSGKYDNVEVEVMEHGSFWTKVLQPFETLRAGMSCAMMVHHAILAMSSEMKKHSGEGGDGV